MRGPLLLVAILSTAIPLRAFSQDTFELQETIGFLILDLNSQTLDEREAAAAELYRIGEPAVPALQRALASKSSERRFRARNILANLRRLDVPPSSGEIIKIEAGIPVELDGECRSLRITRIDGERRLIEADLDADELILDRVDSDSKITLTGKANTLRIARLVGESYVDASKLRLRRLEIAGLNDRAAVKVPPLETLEFVPTVDGITMAQDATGVTIYRSSPVTVIGEPLATEIGKCVATLENFLAGKYQRAK